MSERDAQVVAWRTVREVVTGHLARRRTEIDAQLGLSFIKIKVLRQLAHGRLTMGELASALQIDPPYTSVVIEDLVTRDLVARTTHPDDRRRKFVGLTAMGAEYAATAEEILDQPPEGFADLDDGQLSTLRELFGRVGTVTSG